MKEQPLLFKSNVTQPSRRTFSMQLAEHKKDFNYS